MFCQQIEVSWIISASPYMISCNHVRLEFRGCKISFLLRRRSFDFLHVTANLSYSLISYTVAAYIAQRRTLRSETILGN